MLSMTFISVMLVAIATLIIQISTIYTRGETLRQVNQASRVVTEDMRRTFAAADQRRIDVSKIDNGRLCLGSFTYVWNITPTGTDETPTEANRYADDTQTPIRLIRIVDQGGQYCRSPADGVSPHVNTPIAAAAQPVELLQEEAHRLKVYRVDVNPVMKSNDNIPQLYEIVMKLGTSDSNAALDTTATCRPPTDSDGDINYCAVNEITFTVRVGKR